MIEIFKKIMRYIVTAGSSAIIGGLAADATKNASTIEKICASTAGIVLGGLVGDAASNYMDKTIDDIHDKITAATEQEGDE